MQYKTTNQEVSLPNRSSLTDNPQMERTKKNLTRIFRFLLVYYLVRLFFQAIVYQTINSVYNYTIGETILVILLCSFGLFATLRNALCNLRLFGILTILYAIGSGIFFVLIFVGALLPPNTSSNFIHKNNNGLMVFGIEITGRVGISVTMIFILSIIIAKLTFRLAGFVNTENSSNIQPV